MTASTVTVELGERRYPIEIGRGLLHREGSLSGWIAGDSALLITNSTVAPLYRDAARAAIGADTRIVECVLPDGERFKNLETLAQAFDAAVDGHCDRQTTVIALGGGVLGDMAGFAAAIYQRGVPFIQVPTTLLAQVDSSVGGKTGVNHPRGKNMIGAFHQPVAVVADTAVLDTLEDRQLRAGLAEVIKYGLIGDRPFFDWLEAHMAELLQRDPEALAWAIEQSCRNKAAVVAAVRTRSTRTAEPWPHVRPRNRSGDRLRELASWRGDRRGHVHGGTPLPTPRLVRRGRVRAHRGDLHRRRSTDAAAPNRARAHVVPDGRRQEGP